MNSTDGIQIPAVGTEENAINLDVLRLLAARSAEMMACESSVHIATSQAVAPLQRLPVRLRRRAASHKIQRLPRRLHQGAAQSFSKRLVDQAKKCRRFRRRPQRLAALAAHRAQVPIGNAEGGDFQARWIPTAIWHAKRFHIIQNWGWRIPYAPTDKVFKTLQRAATDRCLLIDHGYLNCFALTGPLDILNRCIEETTLSYYVSSVSPNLSEDTSPSSGFQETVRLLCREALQPRAPIGIARLPNISRPILGPLRILRGPVHQVENGGKHSTVWFWLHPTLSSDAWKMLSSLIYVSAEQKTPESTHIRLADCTGHLCRMKLIGPFSHQILADILQPHLEVPECGDWSLWKAMGEYQKSSLFPSGCGLALLCSSFLANRPRLKLFNRNWLIPEPKVGKETTNRSCSFFSKALLRGEFSEIQQDKRDSIFNDRIAQWFSSAQPCCFSNTGIPVILIQNATPSLASQKSQCVGWDIILPRQLLNPPTDDSRNGTPGVNASAPRDFMVACVYRGIRVGGLRDQLRWACLTTEAAARVDAFPYALWPETPAARLITDEKLHIKVERNEKGKLTGEAKRRSKIKFRCSPPTTKDWLELMKSFHPTVPTSQGEGGDCSADNFFFVLRDKAMLALVVRRLLAGDPRARHLTVDHLSRYDPDLPRALVMVKLEVISRGIPGSKAEIYVPSETDDPSLCQLSAETPRKLIGYVDEGGYAFSHGLCIAIGFIALAAVCSLPQPERLPNGLKTVLFKSSKSGVICAAKMTVII